jgi:hypothetical protein
MPRPNATMGKLPARTRTRNLPRQLPLPLRAARRPGPDPALSTSPRHFPNPNARRKSVSQGGRRRAIGSPRTGSSWGLADTPPKSRRSRRTASRAGACAPRTDRNASLKGKGKSKDEDDNDNDDNADEEEEDLGFKGGWASDSDNAESSFDQIDWDKARKKQMANMRKMMRWTPYLRDDDPNDPEESDALSEDIFGLPSPPPPVLEMMDLFREAILNGLWPYNSKPPAPPAPMAPASKTGPSTDKPDNTSKTTSSKTKVTSPSVPKTDRNAATKPKEKVVKQDRSRDRPGLGIDNGAKAGPSKLRA